MSQQPLRFKDGRVRNAARVSKAQWEEHKDFLCDSYKTTSLRDLVIYMNTTCGLDVNEGQLGTKLRAWKIYKYDTKNALTVDEPLRIGVTELRQPRSTLAKETIEDPVDTFRGPEPQPSLSNTWIPGFTIGVKSHNDTTDQSSGSSSISSQCSSFGTTERTSEVSPGSEILVENVEYDPGLDAFWAAGALHANEHETEDSRQPTPTPIFAAPDLDTSIEADSAPQSNRVSFMSAAASSMSGLASLRSLRMRLHSRESSRMSMSGDSLSELPSSFMKRSSNDELSLRLLKGLSSLSGAFSLASSARTHSIPMSWRPTTPNLSIEEENKGSAPPDPDGVACGKCGKCGTELTRSQIRKRHRNPLGSDGTYWCKTCIRWYYTTMAPAPYHPFH